MANVLEDQRRPGPTWLALPGSEAHNRDLCSPWQCCIVLLDRLVPGEQQAWLRFLKDVQIIDENFGNAA